MLEHLEKLYAKNTNQIDLTHFPEATREFIKQGTRSVGCPESYFPTMILTLMSTCIGTSACVRIKNDWKEYCAIYACLIGDPGYRKTGSVKSSLTQLKRIQEENHRKYLNDLKQYKQLSSDQMKKTDHPTCTLSYVTDSTLEALASAMATNPLGLIWVSDELTQLINSFNSYKSGGGDRQAILSLYNNTQILINRKGDPSPIVLSNPFCSIIGGVQYDPLRKLLSGPADGFADRFVYATAPVDFNPSYSHHEIDQDVIESYDRLINTVYRDSEFRVHSGKIQEYRINHEAKELWVKWQEELPSTKQLLSVKEKSIARCIRFSLILEVFRNTDRTMNEIGVESMLGAISLSNYYFNEYIRLLDFLEGDKTKLKLDRSLDWIRSKSEDSKILQKVGNEAGVPLRKFYSNRIAGVKNKEEALEIWENLANKGHGKIKREGTGNNETVVFVLNKE